MVKLGDIIDSCLDCGCFVEVWTDKDGLHILVNDEK